jgi:hypothetical protein
MHVGSMPFNQSLPIISNYLNKLSPRPEKSPNLAFRIIYKRNPRNLKGISKKEEEKWTYIASTP